MIATAHFDFLYSRAAAHPLLPRFQSFLIRLLAPIFNRFANETSDDFYSKE